MYLNKIYIYNRTSMNLLNTKYIHCLYFNDKKCVQNNRVFYS
jgi:hypothetical protein